ncbi:MAG: class I SAM-dependent methyltransferase [Pirellulaceae bacterium]
MPLAEIDLPLDLDQRELVSSVDWLEDASERIQQFQDRWDRKPIEQFVASDFEWVYQALCFIRQHGLVAGNRFCEWGCGFAVVSCLADQLNWDVIAIEAEADLIAEARRMIKDRKASVELWHGNFLPPGSERLADDDTLPSLGHREACVYDAMGLQVDDFDLIFAYPWPGEGEFLEAVFERYAEVGACLLTFRGPYDLRLVRKLK